MIKVRNWLLKFNNFGKSILTVATDGYVLDSSGRKLFVLKKEPIQLIRTMLENYQDGSIVDCTTSQVVKYNGSNPFEVRNTELINELLLIIYCSTNIKFPQPELAEVLELIQADLDSKESLEKLPKASESFFH